MPRPNKTDQERGFLMSFWKEVRMMEADYGGMVTISPYPSPRPGVFVFRLGFTPLAGELQNHLGTGAVQIEFPNATPQTLAGALWSAAMKLREMVDGQFSAYAARRNGKV